ncbi:exopolysaccharide biosynthesis predicted pyruvyl transferase EpsI [Arcticibacter tournemirensis]|uniref:Polysaccharide pyruvyl transferase domain-containing protein n=1 Tax=Arcticibacter tournemirensis TaxID=699437 RepID=A0A5M9H785_9SPHI|nr:polysaccharide pyruvyl transferase family protein [Arcticibacter tournemirensis]KAA8482025.1 hypothetical protein F1649_12850 [Arcticibacter tournemirensis]TQM49429.1 exopolysaccharide biosynthesis predicted pyruvyl transferase EpsI [Arcticibacter tournemirensis]
MRKKISQKVSGAIRRVFWTRLRAEILFKLWFSMKGKNIFLFGYPIHPNMGDQAQSYCIERWLKSNYPGYNIFPFNYITSFPLALKILRKRIGKDDLIFGHSGYFFFDPHPELPIYIAIARLFKDYKIVILPQTINITGRKLLEETSIALNSHPNLVLLCRDQISYSNAQKHFSNCKLLLYPDIVTSLIGSKEYSFERQGVLFCMRDDLETFYQSGEITALRTKVGKLIQTELTDTTIKASYEDIMYKKEAILNEMLERFAHYKLIITDRYHGTIFSLIASTPVIVLSSADHKLSSGVKWFPESFGAYVKFAETLNDAYEMAQDMLGEEYTHKLPSYFQDNYYAVLKEKL